MGLGKLVGVAALVAGVALGTGMVVSANDPSRGVVARVVDGDTLEAKTAGRTVTIRLLNVDTPETKHPDLPPECLGPEATDFLEQRLPAGTRIRLEYDQVRLDPYGRTLAGVYESDSLVNAEIAAAGLGVAVVFEPNRRFYDQVLSAQEQATSNRLGLFSDSIGCTIPSQVTEVLAASEPPANTTPTTSSEADALVAEVLALAWLADEADRDLRSLITTPVLSVAHRVEASDPFRRLDQRREELRSLLTRLRDTREALVVAEAEAARRAAEAAAAEAARLAEEARVAEEARLAEQRRLEEAQRQATVTKPATKSKPAPRPSKSKTTAPKPPSNPYPGYTGPRCYAPGGKTWRPC